MCGIAGFFGGDNPAHGREALEAMRLSLEHRGPDAHGLYQDPSGACGLAHTRLSILDPTERSNQPFSYQERWVLVFNGEIYNFRELRSELEGRGVAFRTSSDTEVVAALLALDGTAALSRLRGMYALAYWDTRERTLLLARDPFGIKPLYLTDKGNTTAFSSEVRALVSGGWAGRDLDPEGLSWYLHHGSVHPDRPLLRDVRVLPAGTWLSCASGATTRGTIDRVPVSLPPEDTGVEDFGRVFRDSVRAHLCSDVPVGLFLSGGIDSTAVLAAAAAAGPPPRTVTLSFPGTILDESAHAAANARRFGAEPVFRTLDAEREIKPWFSDHLQLQDLPSIDGFNTFCVARVARELGLKVVLSGLGGDELLGGYPTFRRVPRLLKAGKIWAMIPGAQGAARIFARYGRGRAGRLADFLSAPPTIWNAYKATRTVFSDSAVGCLLGRMGFPVPLLFDEVPPLCHGDIRHDVCRFETDTYLQHQLLRDADACSMSQSVELRVPFLDMPLWRTAAHLPADIRFQAGKRLLQKALPEMPADVFARPKMGFTLPMHSWLDGVLAENYSLVDPSLKPVAETWFQKMALIALVSWQRQLGTSGSRTP